MEWALTDDKDDPYGEKMLEKMLSQLKKDPEEEIPVPDIVPRSEWGALPPKETTPLVHPTLVALFTHTETDECLTKDECIQWMRNKQKEDMDERELPDIQYNFYIGSDGTILEGRGWEHEGTKDDHNESIKGISMDFAYIGNYEHKQMSKELIDVGSNLAKYGKSIGLIHENFNITTYWEDHVEQLRQRFRRNPLDDPDMTPELHQPPKPQLESPFPFK